MSGSRNGAIEASEMLAEALKTMDGLLAGTRSRSPPPSFVNQGAQPNHNGNQLHHNGLHDSPRSPARVAKADHSRALKLISELKMTLDSVENKESLFDQLPGDMQMFLLNLVSSSQNNGNFPANGLSASSPVPSSSSSSLLIEDKMLRLEMDKENLLLQVTVLNQQIAAQEVKIHDLEEALTSVVRHSHLRGSHRELLARSAAETHKLDLMAENSNLKLRLATLEKDKHEANDRLALAQRRIEELQGRLNERSVEVADLRTRLVRNGPSSVPSSPERSDSFREKAMDKEKTLERLKRKHNEVDKLKKAVDCLMQANEEKDRHIDELGRLLNSYKKMEDIVLSGHTMRDQLTVEDDRSDSSSNRSHHREPQPERLSEYEGVKPVLPNIPNPGATSTPVNRGPSLSRSPHLNGNHPVSPLSNINTSAQSSPDKSLLPRSSSLEDVNKSTSSEPYSQGNNYAQTETDDEMLKDEMAQEYKAMQENTNQPQPLTRKKSKGLKRFFGKLRRSSSQDLDKENMDQFQRNALRSTAGGRFCINSTDTPFSSWDSDRVAMWLHAIGLSMYVGECRRWVKTGQQLVNASDHTLEKEMGMRNHFHRKKLHLAIQRYTATGPELTALPRALDLIDHNFVTRWLDDVGLPQYKDMFTDARLDGRMLHFLTVEDLLLLKVSNALHHLSIKRGIQVLRKNDFNQNCLKRRAVSDEGQLIDCPEEVCLWTNHRVMEWLRSIDLSEYAPNLRGSGVHGGLMVLEPQFSAEMLASILSIPSSKTLLRRHLSTHFVSLIGNRTQQGKRDHESSPGYAPLTPNQKVKLKKHGLFSGHKRTRIADEDLVCPMSNGSALSRSSSERDPSSLRKGKRDGSLPKDEYDTRSPYSDAYYTQDISSLTTRLAQDSHLLDDVPTSDV